MQSQPPSTERRIFHWGEEGITCELDLPELIGPQLAPRLRRRRDIEWLGVIRRANGPPGALGRLRANGSLVEAFGRSVSVMRPSVAQALTVALHEQLAAILSELNGPEVKS